MARHQIVIILLLILIPAPLLAQSGGWRTVANIAFMNTENLYDTITKIVSESGIFSVDLTAIAGFVPRVVGYLEHIEEYGMAATLKKFLG